MRLVELANKPYELSVYDKGDYFVTYNFVTENGQYYYINIQLYDEELDIEFEAAEVSAGKGQSVLNTGNAFRVFATVVEALKKAMANKTVNKISFMSKKAEPSRVKLYDAFIKALPKYIPGFRFDDKNDNELPSYYTYTFVREGTE